MPHSWKSVSKFLPDWKESSPLCPAGIHVFTITGIFYSKTKGKQSGVHLFARSFSGDRYSFFIHAWSEPVRLQGLFNRVVSELRVGDSAEFEVFISLNGIAKLEEIRKVEI